MYQQLKQMKIGTVFFGNHFPVRFELVKNEKDYCVVKASPDGEEGRWYSLETEFYVEHKKLTRKK